jgi:hypothetical protein
VFFLYLLQHRPKQVLDIFSKYRLLTLLEINYEKELDLFLKIASPLTMKEDKFDKLRTVILPLAQLPSSSRRKLLSFLNASVHTFQGVRADFVKALKATEGWEEFSLSDYSFTDLVYIYLKYMSNPSVKLKNILKSIKKLQREESKCLKLIQGKRAITELNEMEQHKLRSCLKDMSDVFFEPLLALYTSSVEDKLKLQFKKMFHISEIKRVTEKANNLSFQNALMILKRLSQDSQSEIYSLCFRLLQNYLQEQTYPFIKNLLSAYPWRLPENQAWLKKHLRNRTWMKDFRKTYHLVSEDVKKTNVPERINHHLQQAESILSQLGVTLQELTIEEVDAAYKRIAAERSKYDDNVVSDLKTQVNALRSLQGQLRAEAKTGQKIIIQPEFDPLEILQMGNYVSGSCLNTHGANYWSAVVNAVEVNKRVLWAKDSKDNILARVLIAIDNDYRLVRFPTYYACNFTLDEYFNDYIRELAKRCQLGVNGNVERVEHLFSRRWYTDKPVSLTEVG